jgi:hypothetical protein
MQVLLTLRVPHSKIFYSQCCREISRTRVVASESRGTEINTDTLQALKFIDMVKKTEEAGSEWQRTFSEFIAILISL